MDVKVGGEVDSYCTTCRTMRLHNVVAMVGTRPVRVLCRSCQGQHSYRARMPGVAAPRSTKPRVAKTARTVVELPSETFYSRISARECEAQRYSPSDRYPIDAVIRHPTFGCGIVVALPHPQKVEVQFESGVKLLLHDRHAAVIPTLQRPTPPIVRNLPPEE